MATRARGLGDRVAIAAAATTGFTATNTERSPLAYACEASVAALRAAGLGAPDVDGVVGTPDPTTWRLQEALGIPEVTFSANPYPPFVNVLATAAAAVHAGLCEVVLAYHAAYRQPWNTSAALADPFRRVVAGMAAVPETVASSVGYTAWASRYLHEHALSREDLALVAINARTNALANPAAALRRPLTMEEYLAAPMIREPLGRLDMDLSVDGGDAFVVTTTERARDLALRPVVVDALTLGTVARNDEAQTPSLREHGQQVVVRALRDRASFWIDDCDVYFPYDGFTVIALNWIENVGWCGPGEASAFLRDHWDDGEARVLVDGRMPLNPHGGSLAEGATQGSGHVREAVHQLQGLAGARQVPAARRALVTAGGFFFNAQGVTLRAG